MEHPKKPGYSGSRPLSSLLESITQPVFSRRGYLEARLLTDWRLITGEKIAARTLPQRVVFPNNETKSDGVLHIEVFNSAIATELTYSGPVLLEKIAIHLGYKAISRLKLHLRPLSPALADKNDTVQSPPLSPEKSQALSALIHTVDDPALRDVLYRLGECVMGDTKNTPSAKK